MCGIVGYVGAQFCKDFLVSGLRRLEYRGYDSSGVAIHTANGFQVVRSTGKIAELEKRLERTPFDGFCGLGHTRWATHGAPTEYNAHPHCAGRVAVVHNGIIENYSELRKRLIEQGRTFHSDTDTEVLAHLVDSHFFGDRTLHAALLEAQKEVRGSYAVVVSNIGNAQELVAARAGSPLVIGSSDDGVYMASDVPALLEQTRTCVWIEDGETAIVRANGSIRIFDPTGTERHFAFETIEWDLVAAKKNGFEHFMLKEIYEQPQALRNTIMPRISADGALDIKELEGLTGWMNQEMNRVVFVACGSSYYASLLGKSVIETWAGVPVEVCIGSEFRYSSTPVDHNTLVIAVSQSGETADTLVSLKNAIDAGAKTVAVCNVVGSSIARCAGHVVFTNAGPEVSVASTKAFVCQYAALLLLALQISKAKETKNEEELRELVNSIVAIPDLVQETLEVDDVQLASHSLIDAKVALFIGRQLGYPIALEGALKLKEIAYIPAQGYAAGELKHGPIALIESATPVVAIGTSGMNYEKMVSNVCEVKSRGSHLIAIVDQPEGEMRELADSVVQIPFAPKFVEPLLVTLVVQLLAYHVASAQGRDVDRPRNLAKSVTVE